jgi:cyclase
MKKNRNLILCGLFFLFASVAFASEGLVKISDNVYSYVYEKGDIVTPNNSYKVNCGVVVGDDGVLVIDTLISAKEAERFISDIRKITDKPIKYVVNTHYHLDHAFGNSEFVKLGAIVISQEKDEESLEKSGPAQLKDMKSAGLSDDDMLGTSISPAKITFSDRMSINMGNTKVELIYLGASHSSGSIVILLPKEKILFAGDALFTDFYPFIADGDLKSWVKVLDSIQKMDVNIIIPGHGPISSKKDVTAMKEYILLFDKNAKKLSASSNDPQKIALELKNILPKRSQLDWSIGANVELMYLKKNQDK